MFRRIIRSAIELAQRWIDEPAKHPAGAPEPEPPKRSADVVDYIARAKAAERCYACAAPKGLGEILCDPCTEVRKPKRTPRATQRQGTENTGESGR